MLRAHLTAEAHGRRRRVLPKFGCERCAGVYESQSSQRAPRQLERFALAVTWPYRESRPLPGAASRERRTIAGVSGLMRTAEERNQRQKGAADGTKGSKPTAVRRAAL